MQPRRLALDTSLDAQIRAPSTCIGSDHTGRESARERSFARPSSVRPGRVGFSRGASQAPGSVAVGTRLDAPTRAPSTCTDSDHARQQSARERAFDRPSAVTTGRWTMRCASTREPPRTAAKISMEASTYAPSTCTASYHDMRDQARAMSLHRGPLGSSDGGVSDKPREEDRRNAAWQNHM